MMKKLTQNIILTILMLATPVLGFAGQHSGLGGTPPSAPPAPDPGVFESLEQYYNQYYQWLREQMESGAEQQQPSVAQPRK